MNYTLHQLQIFHAVVQHRSITRAAELLHLTQPAVSIQLKNFQEQFELPLIEIIGRKVHVTPFGQEIAGSAQRILEEVQEIRQKSLAFKGELTGKLTIAVVSTGKYVMPYFLTDFMQAHPGISLIMDVTNKARVVESLQKNEVDFALVSILPAQPALEWIDLLPNELYLVGLKAPISSSKKNTKQFLESLPFIFREAGSGTRKHMEAFLKEHKIRFQKTMELTSNEAVKQAVLAGLGYSIMPSIGIRDELQKGSLQIIQVKGLPIRTSWQLTWLRNKKLSPVAAAFLNHLQTNKERIIQEHFKAGNNQ